MNSKFKLLKDDFIYTFKGRLYRIEALKDFGNIRKGDKGGYVKGEHNLSPYGYCWIYDDARVYDNAFIFGNAKVFDKARVYDKAFIKDNAVISGKARVYDNALCGNSVKIYDNARVFNFASVLGESQVFSFARVYGKTYLNGNAVIRGRARIYDSSEINGEAVVFGNARVFGGSRITERARIYENAHVYGNSCISGDTEVCGDARVTQSMSLKLGKCTLDLSKKENLEQNITFQTGLPIFKTGIGEYVMGFKYVNKTLDPNVFKSLHDPNFKYKLNEWAEVENPDMSNRSCTSGLHFSSLYFWEKRELNTVIQVKCYLDDIITVQEGKIRCKKLLPLAVVKNGFCL